MQLHFRLLVLGFFVKHCEVKQGIMFFLELRWFFFEGIDWDFEFVGRSELLYFIILVVFYR